MLCCCVIPVKADGVHWLSSSGSADPMAGCIESSMEVYTTARAVRKGREGLADVATTLSLCTEARDWMMPALAPAWRRIVLRQFTRYAPWV